MKLILLGLLLSINVLASDCTTFKEESPVLAGGRVKPFLVLSKESVKFLTGKSKYKDQTQNQSICKLLTNSAQEDVKDFPILVEHVDSKKLLSLKEDESFILASKASNLKELVRSEIFKQKETNSYKKDLNKLYARIDLYQKLVSGEAISVYTGKEDTTPKGWQMFSEVKNLENINSLIDESKDLYISKHNDIFLTELTYSKLHLFGFSLLFVLVGLAFTVLTKSLKWPVIMSFVIIGIETVAMIFRMMISGRAPITNMYETVMFSGYGALVLALGILYFKREKIFLLAGLSYNMLCLFMIIFANGMLDSSISPLVPVLRDNFWLSTHVTTIILSYAALALSWIAANIALFKMRFKTITKKEYRLHQELIYTCIKVGIVLLAAGIILGGVWADYSWGRFWGWDPKETWSLIVLLFYMILVHGRYSSWINTHRFIILSAAGFMSVMMAWFGVNYILASGLHSYGFSEGGAIFLGTFFFIQTVYLVICAKAKFES